MARRSVEKPFAGGQWTTAQMRSFLRRMSLRWPPRRMALKSARVPYVGPNKRRKWSYRCAECHELFAETEVEVHHMEPAGSLLTFEDIGPFVERLLCEPQKLEVLCDGCHHIETHGKVASDAQGSDER